MPGMTISVLFVLRFNSSFVFSYLVYFFVSYTIDWVNVCLITFEMICTRVVRSTFTTFQSDQQLGE